MKFFATAFVVSVLLILFSCKENNRAAMYVRELNTSDSFRFDFPVRTSFDSTIDTGLYKFLVRYDSLIQIQPLFNGFDSIQIRIWLSEIYNDTAHLFVFKNENKEWTGELCTLVENPKKDTTEIIRVKKSCEPVFPNTGWRRFINKIFELKILSLPDNLKIKGWNHGLVTHDERPTIEIATKNVYRLYAYSGLDTVTNNFPETKNLCRIFELLKQEFNYVPLTEYCWGRSTISTERDTVLPDDKPKVEVVLEEIKQHPVQKRKRKKRN